MFVLTSQQIFVNKFTKIFIFRNLFKQIDYKYENLFQTLFFSNVNSWSIPGSFRNTFINVLLVPSENRVKFNTPSFYYNKTTKTT